MSAATAVVDGGRGARPPWRHVLLSAVSCVSWALIGMAGTAALGLHLLRADAAGSLGPMTAAAVALGAGGTVRPSGDVSAFGLHGAQAHTAVEITPLGVSLVGALLLSWLFLRSLRAAPFGFGPGELLVRAGAVVALFVAMLGGLAWAGHDVVTLDGSSLGLDGLPGGAGPGGVRIPGVGDLGDLGGLLPDRIGGLVDAKAAVGFTVDAAPTLLGGLGWSAGVLLIALLASHRTPLPRGWDAVHRVVRPAVSALVAVLLVAVAAGLAAAAYAALGDDHPGRVLGAAVLGAPDGVWLGVPLGLFVPWDGAATGGLAHLLPAPLDRLLDAHSGRPVTLVRLAELDGRVWLLAVAAALMMLLAGVLTAVRTPVGTRVRSSAGAGFAAGRGGFAAGPGRLAAGPGGVMGGAVVGAPVRTGLVGPDGAAAGGDGGRPGAGVLGFVGRCALRLGVVTALALPLLAWLTRVSVNASLSVFGLDAFGAGIELHGHLGAALLLGAVWGCGAGAAGAVLATATGAAGRRAAPFARGAGDTLDAVGVGGPGDVRGDAGDVEGAGGGLRGAGDDLWGAGGVRGSAGVPDAGAVRDGAGGPYSPSAPYRPPNPATNPYLRLPGGPAAREEVRGEGGGSARPPRPTSAPKDVPDDVHGAPTLAGPVPPPPVRPPVRGAPPGRPARPRPSGAWPPPPPPPPDDAPPPPKPSGPPPPPRPPRK
ncbi:streptophobe family protein [Streptomyces sp. BBFR115]|uniref:streptophobe family protein n=1 Tax=Streptomyces sp. BBFR115 TaxID=3448173 RepID=UPI003F759167